MMVMFRITFLVGDAVGGPLNRTLDVVTGLVWAVAESLGLGNGFCYD